MTRTLSPLPPPLTALVLTAAIGLASAVRADQGMLRSGVDRAPQTTTISAGPN